MSGEEQSSKNEDLRMAYQQVCSSHNAIADFRAKLLGFLPLASGTGVFLLLNNNVATNSAAKQYIWPVGIFGFVVTLGLFFYELRGIQQCNRLTAVGEKIEDLLTIDGQFNRRIDPPRPYISHTFAARVIYPAVLAAWIFLVLAFIQDFRSNGTTFLQWMILIAVPLFIFLVGLSGSFTVDLNGKLEKDSSEKPSLILLRMLDIIALKVQADPTDKTKIEELKKSLENLSQDNDVLTLKDRRELSELMKRLKSIQIK
jgi:hypothetical protein